MGATVLEAYGDGGYLVGSFNGIYHLERSTGNAINMMSEKVTKTWSNVRPGDFMVTGFYNIPGETALVSTHEQGLLQLNNGKPPETNRFQMPAQLHEEFRMPLWNYLFELHNGRFFKGFLGGFYILLVPLGSLLFIVITLTGIFDWICLKFLLRKKETS